ncbi:MAG: hypothetical protein AMXMBFR74_17570 [Parvibaculum sp.]|uniref:hypothetical protein n=1 Tax=Parvibaculum sp. TaxID=2024848 RepID=UPI0035B9F9D6
MTQSVLQRMKGFFYSVGVKNSQTEIGTPYFNESEKRLLLQGLHNACEEAAEVASVRGYKVNDRVAQIRRAAAERA